MIRGSIGLANGADTPLRQGKDIPLTGARRQEEGGREDGGGGVGEQERDREKGRF